VVTYGGDLLGILTRTAVDAIPAEQGQTASVYRHMIPIHQVSAVPEDTSALAALRLMLGRRLTDVAVTAHGQIVGVLSLASLLHAARLPGSAPGRARSHATALQLLDV
jgi:CBS domain-containing protein